jgi:hypothetical protein
MPLRPTVQHACTACSIGTRRSNANANSKRWLRTSSSIIYLRGPIMAYTVVRRARCRPGRRDGERRRRQAAAPGRSVSRRVTVRTFLVWGPRAGLPHWRGAGRRPGRKRQARACPWLGCVRWLCVRTGRAHDFSFECTPSAIHGRFHRWVRGRHATRAWSAWRAWRG